MSSTNSAATISNLRAALASAQAALDEARNELNSLRLENANLKAAALGSAVGPRRKTHFLWVKPSVFQSPCPPNLISIETQYLSTENTMEHIRYRLYECVPERYHSYLEELSEFGINFNKLAQQQRSNLISRLHTRTQNLFGPSYPEITLELWANAEVRGRSEICHQLYMEGQKFEPLLAPIIYSRGVIDADGIFQNDVLFLIGICSLFGYSAVRGKKPKNSHGMKWGIKSVTSGFISFCCVVAIHLLSNDTSFEEIGAKSGIDYGSAFLAYKQRIEIHQESPRFQKIIKIWNMRLFGEADTDSNHETFDIPASNNSRLAALDAALSEVPSECEGPPISAMSRDVDDLAHNLANMPLSSVSNVQQTNSSDGPSISHGTQISSLSNSHRNIPFTLPTSTPGSVLTLDQENSENDDEGEDSPALIHHPIVSSGAAISSLAAPIIIPSLSDTPVPARSTSPHAPIQTPSPMVNVLTQPDGGPTRGGKTTRGRGRGRGNMTTTEKTRRSTHNRS